MHDLLDQQDDMMSIMEEDSAFEDQENEHDDDEDCDATESDLW